MCPIAFGGSGAKRSQDDKPLTHQRPVRTASVAQHSLRSHLSLRSRCGMEVSATWPLLSRLSPAPHIPARPFGLGWRFDVARSVTPNSFECHRPNVYQTSVARGFCHRISTLATANPIRYRATSHRSDPFCRAGRVANTNLSPGVPPNRTGALAHLAPSVANFFSLFQQVTTTSGRVK